MLCIETELVRVKLSYRKYFNKALKIVQTLCKDRVEHVV